MIEKPGRLVADDLKKTVSSSSSSSSSSSTHVALKLQGIKPRLVARQGLAVTTNQEL